MSWTLEQFSFPFNAGYLVCKDIRPRIRSDIVIASPYISNWEENRSLTAQREADLIFAWAKCHMPPLSAMHNLGVENWQAHSCINIWSVVFFNLNYFKTLSQVWDNRCGLLAFRFFSSLCKFVTRSRNSPVFAVDALVSLWDEVNLIYDFSRQTPC